MPERDFPKKTICKFEYIICQTIFLNVKATQNPRSQLENSLKALHIKLHLNENARAIFFSFLFLSLDYADIEYI